MPENLAWSPIEKMYRPFASKTLRCHATETAPIVSLVLLFISYLAATEPISRDGHGTVTEVHVFHILNKTQAESQRIYEQLQSVAPSTLLREFQQAAKTYSIDTGSARIGGDLGVAQVGLFVKEFDQAALETPINQVSAPFKTVFGWHLVLVTDRQVVDVKARCEKSLQAAVNAASGKDSEGLKASLWIRDPAQINQTVIQLMDPSWGSPFLGPQDELTFIRIDTQKSKTQKPRVQIHSEMPSPTLLMSGSCYRSMQQTFTADCEQGRLAFSRRVLFEGRAATGKIQQETNMPAAKQKFEPVELGTMAARLYGAACQAAR